MPGDAPHSFADGQAEDDALQAAGASIVADEDVGVHIGERRANIDLRAIFAAV